MQDMSNEKIIDTSAIPYDFSAEKEDKTSPYTKTIEQSLREKGITTKIDVSLFLGPHASEDDMNNVENNLDTCDIFVPEMVNLDDDMIVALEDVSYGRKTAEQVLNEYKDSVFEFPFASRLLCLLYNKKKVIAHVDLMAGDSLLQEMAEIFDHKKIMERADPKVASDMLADSMIKYAETQKRREAYIAGKLPEEVTRQFERHPELKQKEHVEILMFMGSVHGTLRDDLSYIADNVKTELADSTLVYGFAHEIYKRSQYGKNISESLKMNALMERVLSYCELPSSASSHDKWRFMRKAIFLFTEDEIKKVWKTTAGKTAKEIQIIISDIFSKKNIPIPTTEEEFDIFIGG